MSNRQSDSFIGLPPEDKPCLVIIGGSGLVGNSLIKKLEISQKCMLHIILLELIWKVLNFIN